MYSMDLSPISVRSRASSRKDNMWTRTEDPISVSLVPESDSICRLVAEARFKMASSPTKTNPVRSKCVSGSSIT